MVDMLEPKPTDVIGDPACGTGGFLVQSMLYLLETYTSRGGVLEETDPETGKTEKIYTGDLLEAHREHNRSHSVASRKQSSRDSNGPQAFTESLPGRWPSTREGSTCNAATRITLAGA